MEIASLVISTIALILAAGLYITAWATKSVIQHSQLKALPYPVSEGELTHWLVELEIGEGNFICQLLNKININWVPSNLYANTTFEMEDGSRYNSAAYDIEYGIRDKKRESIIIPNIRKQLAIAQRFEDSSLRTMGDA
jgi:hypothetical protein